MAASMGRMARPRDKPAARRAAEELALVRAAACRPQAEAERLGLAAARAVWPALAAKQQAARVPPVAARQPEATPEQLARKVEEALAQAAWPLAELLPPAGKARAV